MQVTFKATEQVPSGGGGWIDLPTFQRDMAAPPVPGDTVVVGTHMLTVRRRIFTFVDPEDGHDPTVTVLLGWA